METNYQIDAEPAEPDKAVLMPPHKSKTRAKASAAKKEASRTAKPTKESKPAKAKKTRAERLPAKTEAGDSKKTQVLEMIQRKGGATLDEICKVTGWQRHTTRSFISTVPAKMGLKLISENVGGQRTYRAA